MIKLFYPSPESVVKRHLREAKLEYLDQMNKAEYHTAMAAMLLTRIERLEYETVQHDQDRLAAPVPGHAPAMSSAWHFCSRSIKRDWHSLRFFNQAKQ